MTTPAWVRRFPTVTLISGSANADLPNDSVFTADVRSYTLPDVSVEVVQMTSLHGGRGTFEAPVRVNTSDMTMVITGSYAGLLATLGSELGFSTVEEAVNYPANTARNQTYEVTGMVKSVSPGQVTIGSGEIPGFTLTLSTRVYKYSIMGIAVPVWDIDHISGTYNRNGTPIMATTPVI